MSHHYAAGYRPSACCRFKAVGERVAASTLAPRRHTAEPVENGDIAYAGSPAPEWLYCRYAGEPPRTGVADVRGRSRRRVAVSKPFAAIANGRVGGKIAYALRSGLLPDVSGCRRRSRCRRHRACTPHAVCAINEPVWVASSRSISRCAGPDRRAAAVDNAIAGGPVSTAFAQYGAVIASASAAVRRAAAGAGKYGRLNAGLARRIRWHSVRCRRGDTLATPLAPVRRRPQTPVRGRVPFGAAAVAGQQPTMSLRNSSIGDFSTFASPPAPHSHPETLPDRVVKPSVHADYPAPLSPPPRRALWNEDHAVAHR